ncbi:MAG: HD domain-containing protein [Burkholderiales bacterium]
MDDVARLIKAADFAAAKHRMQRRKDAEASPYINHSLALARVLKLEAGVDEVDVLVAAILHDTVEDTETTVAELSKEFGPEIASIVAEVTDDESLPKPERKRLQVVRAPGSSRPAKLVKLADKICNLRDVRDSPPAHWPLERRQAYFEWAREVIDGLRGVHPGLEAIFDEAYRAKP